MEVKDTGGFRERNVSFCFRETPSSHSLSTPASRCILHANNSACTIVHAAYNAFINVDDQMDFRLYRLMYRLYLASSPRTTISVWALHWIVPSENAWFVVRGEILRMRKLPIRPCPLIILFRNTQRRRLLVHGYFTCTHTCTFLQFKYVNLLLQAMF